MDTPEPPAGNYIPPPRPAAPQPPLSGAPAPLPPAPAAANTIPPSNPVKDPVLALLLNLFLWCVGYFYIGQWQKGLISLLTPLFSLMFLMMTCLMGCMLVPAFLIVPIGQVVDVYLQAKNLQDGRTIGQWTFFREHL